MEIIFWISVGIILYTYFIYPIVLSICSGIHQVKKDAQYLFNRNQRRTKNIDDLPNVSIIIAAYNEESCIEERIKNLLLLDYPSEKINIHIGSDGSSDGTNSILSNYSADNYHAHLFEQNRGKMSVLNDLVQLCNDEIIVFSDANTHFQTDVIKKLVRHFADEKMGVVCGELHLVDGASGDNMDSIYWRYEQVLKFHESRLGALLGANGAIYAIRKSLFEPLPANTIVDDFQIAMNISRNKYTTHYDPEAVAIEEVAPNLKAEAGRRVRIGLGNYQAFFKMSWALNPLLGWRFIAYISHKVFRWFVPHMMILALLTNLMLWDQPIYQLILLLQVTFYGIAVYGLYQESKGRKSSGLITLMSFFLSMNIALLKGFIRYFTSNVQGTWQRTTR